MRPEKSDHFDGRRFVNPTGMTGQPLSAVPRMLLTQRTPWPATVEVPPQRAHTLNGSAAVVTFIGHSTFLIQTAEGNVLTDPVYAQHAGPFGLLGPRRVSQRAVLFYDLPSVSIVLLSHNHYDHFDRRTLGSLAEKFDPLVVTPLGNAALLEASGIRRIEELDWWETSALSTLPIVLTPAQHFSARTPLDKNRALWGGFVLRAGGRRIFFAGDTAYARFFRDIRER